MRTIHFEGKYEQAAGYTSVNQDYYSRSQMVVPPSGKYRLVGQPFDNGNYELFVNFTSASTATFGFNWNSSELRMINIKRAVLTMRYGTTNSELVMDSKTLADVPGTSFQKYINIPQSYQSSAYSLTFQIDVQACDTITDSENAIRFLRLKNLYNFRHSSDVCLFFPDTDQMIWASSAILREASPHFAALLTSDFKEGEKKHTAMTEVPVKKGYDDLVGGDSDAEKDSLASDGERTQNSEDSCPVGFHQIDITDTLYKTYKAVVHWIYTGHVTFAPLRSLATQIEADDATEQNKDELSASPKSVYRLSHYLEIEELQKLALYNFQSQICVENVASEMYSEVAGLYPELRKIAVTFAARNWAKVKVTEAWMEMKGKLDAGEVPFAGLVGADLAEML